MSEASKLDSPTALSRTSGLGSRVGVDEMKEREQQIGPNESNARVPLFGNWRNAYLAVVAVFVFEIAFFYFVSRHFL